MDVALLCNLEKYGHIMRVIDTLYLALNERFSDHAKRVLLRYLFIQIDNLEKLASRLKNQLVAAGYLNSKQRDDVEAAISHLLKSYTKSLDVVRDKIAAHAQHIDLASFLMLWNTVDATLIELLYQDLKALEDSFRISNKLIHEPVGADFAPLSGVAGTRWAPPTSPILAMDRSGLTRADSVAIVPMHVVQETTQLAVTTVDALLLDFELTAIVDNPATVYNKYLFDIGWWMAITDTCALIDTLFTETTYAQSLIEVWRDNDIKGVDVLNQLATMRHHSFENQVRLVRNRLAAHIDAVQPLAQLNAEYESINLLMLHSYSHVLLQTFQQACARDVRTAMFAAHDHRVADDVQLHKPLHPFDEMGDT